MPSVARRVDGLLRRGAVRTLRSAKCRSKGRNVRDLTLYWPVTAPLPIAGTTIALAVFYVRHLSVRHLSAVPIKALAHGSPMTLSTVLIGSHTRIGDLRSCLKDLSVQVLAEYPDVAQCMRSLPIDPGRKSFFSMDVNSDSDIGDLHHRVDRIGRVLGSLETQREMFVRGKADANRRCSPASLLSEK